MVVWNRGYCSDRSVRFWAVFWIDVSTKDIAERSLLKAAQRLSINAQDWEDALYGIANLQHPWLLIFDNADNVEVDYQDYFPDSRHGVIVMTTRNEECEQYGTDQSVALPGLDPNETQTLLFKAAGVSLNYPQRYAEDAQRVARLLQSHPLALIQAGNYIKRGHCSLADYSLVYETRRQQLLTFRPAQARSRYGDVYATFEVSAAMLKAMDTPASRDALQLLPLLAVCSPSHFPLSLFKAGWKGANQIPSDLDEAANDDDDVYLLTPWHIAHLPTICDTASQTWDPHRLIEAVALLKAFSLVSTDAQTDTQTDLIHVSLHTLVHAWARDRQDRQQQQQQAWLQMGCLTACALKSESFTPKQKRWLQPHVEALVSWSVSNILSAGPPVLIARILVRCGFYLSDQRADAKLSAFLHEIFVALKLDQVKVQQQWIGLYALAAQNSLDNGRFKEAVTLLEDMVEIRKQALAVNHPSRLSSQHLLAAAYQANGQTQEAVALLEEVLNIRKHIHAADHSDRLDSQHGLARAYLANGQAEEAVALLEDVVEIRKQIHPADHSARLSSQHELAVAYKANGQTEEALALLKEVVKIKKHTHAADHPDRLASQSYLAICLWEAGEREVPLRLITEVVDIVREKNLNEHHPDREWHEYWLARFEREMAALEIS